MNTGGPAFPVPAELCQDLTVEQQRGMTLRDYFAAKAMEAMIASPHMPAAFDMRPVAKKAYIIADAMLKAREA